MSNLPARVSDVSVTKVSAIVGALAALGMVVALIRRIAAK